MKVMKFGGTSVQDAAAMKRVAAILRAESGPLVVVLSATSGSTDALLAMLETAALGKFNDALTEVRRFKDRHAQIIDELGMGNLVDLKKQIERTLSRLNVLLQGVSQLREKTSRARDAVLSHGELISTMIFARYLDSLGEKAKWLDVREVMLTDSQFGTAQPQLGPLRERCKSRWSPQFKEKRILVTQGFIGATKDGLTTTLGRGGSDYSAALLGYALDAQSIEIWTDVSGIMSADPRVVTRARPQKEISFREAAELAYFGAKVLHPSTILPAMERQIPVRVKNTQRPGDPGTLILPKTTRSGEVKALTFRKHIMMITVESSRMLNAYGFLEQIFDVFARHQVPVDLVSTSEISVSLTIDDTRSLEHIVPELQEFSMVTTHNGCAIIALIGDDIKNAPNFLMKTFEALDSWPVEMITFGASNVNLSIVIKEIHLNEAFKALHKTFFE